MNIKQIFGGRNKHKKCRRGFTLVEVLVTVLIFSVLMAAINAVLLVGESSWQTNSVRTELVQEVRKAVAKMENDLRQTTSNVITITFLPAPLGPDQSITFNMPEGVTGKVIDWSANTFRYVLGGTDSNQLQRVERDGITVVDTEVIAQNISALNFAQVGRIIEVTLQAQKDTIKRRTLTVNFAFKVQMRN